MSSWWFPMILAAGWVFLAISRANVKKLLDDSMEVIQQPLSASGTALQRLSSETKEGKKAAQDVSNRAVQVLEAVLAKMQASVNALTDHTYRHLRLLLAQCGPNVRTRLWRIIGSSTELIVAVLFLYTDAALAASALVTVEPALEVPTFLGDLVIPLIMSSAGTVFMMGMILGDFMGLTHFSIWREVRGKLRMALITIVVINLLVTITCSFLLSLNRFPVLVASSEAARLPSEVSADILRLAALSQSIITIPLLVTTVLMFRALTGLAPLLALVVAVTMGGFKLISLCIDILRLIVRLGGMGNATALAIIFFILQVILGFLAGTLLTAVTMGNKLLSVGADLIDIVTQPLVLAGQTVSHAVSRVPWFTQPTPPVPPPSQDEIEALLKKILAQQNTSTNGHNGIPVSTNGHASGPGPDDPPI